MCLCVYVGEGGHIVMMQLAMTLLLLFMMVRDPYSNRLVTTSINIALSCIHTKYVDVGAVAISSCIYMYL
jgi:hypothetical protein